MNVPEVLASSGWLLRDRLQIFPSPSSELDLSILKNRHLAASKQASRRQRRSEASQKAVVRRDKFGEAYSRHVDHFGSGQRYRTGSRPFEGVAHHSVAADVRTRSSKNMFCS